MSFKRRNYFIDKGAQGRFMAGFALASMAGGVVSVFCFRYLARKKLAATLYSMRLPDVPVGSLLREEMLITSLITAFLVILLFALTAKMIFARIDGPLKKMAGAIGNIGDGDLQSKVKLRENDEFQDFSNEVDAMVGSMRSRLQKLHDSAEKMRERCQAMESGKDVELGPLKSYLAALKYEMKALKL
ncbi:MAG: methyl-accepting chemotaxis protein [Desulfobulbaceae bacterium]|nr:methyl-accepting chemotaxis protein [Desulfobulbaceae bacterium]